MSDSEQRADAAEGGGGMPRTRQRKEGHLSGPAEVWGTHAHHLTPHKVLIPPPKNEGNAISPTDLSMFPQIPADLRLMLSG